MTKINFAAAQMNNVELEVEVVETQTTNEEMVEMVAKTTEVKEEMVVTAENVETLGYNAMRKLAKEMGLKLGRVGKDDLLVALKKALAPAIEEPAVDETSAAGTQEEVVEVEETKIEEEVQMTNVETKVEVKEEVKAASLPAEVLARNARALDNSRVLGDELKVQQKVVHGYEDPQHKLITEYVYTAARRFMESVGEYGVRVVGIEWFGQYDRRNNYGRVGMVTVVVPRGFMVVSQWNGVAKKFEWIEAADVNFDHSVQGRKAARFNALPAGSGVFSFFIKEDKDGKAVVRLPKSENKGVFYDVIKTADIRWGRPHSDNNANFEAAISAFVQVQASEFVVENPKNRHGFSESCMNCRHLVYLGIKDGVNDDMEEEGSTRVLQQPDIPTLANWGSRLPQAYCPIVAKYVDMDIIKEANAAEGKDRGGMVYDSETGEERFLRAGEIEIRGEAVKLAEIREVGTKETAASCVNYHKNQFKGEHRIGLEKVEQKEATGSDKAFVSAYWTDRAEIGRQVVEVLEVKDGKENWVKAFPGEVKDPEAFRIKGLGGVTIYGSEEVMEASNGNFIPEEAAFDADRASNMAKVNQIFYAAFNLNKLTKDQAESVFALAQNKPEGLDRRTEAAWDSAVKWLFEMLQRALNPQEEVAAFDIFFKEGAKPAGAQGVELRADDFLEETRYREANDMLGYGLGYKDLAVNPKEFVKYLDESFATERVYEVLTEGTVFYIKSRSAKDKVLVAGAAQELLQREVNRYMSAVRRDANPVVALENVGLHSKVKAYIANAIGLNK